LPANRVSHQDESRSPHEPSAPATGGSDAPESLKLVHQGWHDLQLQRPLAAWSDWQRALRAEPDNGAALSALERLAAAPELPASARAVYRFQAPADADRRARWDARLRGQGQGLDDLKAAAEAFDDLTRDDPSDADAWYNLALCHAWGAANAQAVSCLDRVVSLLAADDPDRAAGAWTLAEVLRQGAGAESLADDCRYAWVVEFEEGRSAPEGLFDRWPNLVERPIPADPVTGVSTLGEGRAFEWLDRPVPEPGATLRPEDLPRVLATVVSTPRVLRLSSPDPTGFTALSDPSLDEVRGALESARREKTPLPIGMADAGLATFRLPAGLSDEARNELTRGAVEHYFEDLWVHQPRQSLGGRTPLEAAAAAQRGDAIARARLAAVVGYREQLGARTSRIAVYQGYPFDRLRRRLGLIEVGEGFGSVDAEDASCMSGPELDRLDPAALATPRLADAFTSSAYLGDDARTARFAAELVGRGSEALAGLNVSALFAVLVRESLRLGEPDVALDWLARGHSLVGDRQSRVFSVWSAEIHARTGEPDAALKVYQDLLAHPDATASEALDAAETLLDNGYPDHALPLLKEARDRARREGNEVVQQKSETLLGPAG
jgi:tetratricopeptide (TPR) repeat protein